MSETRPVWPQAVLSDQILNTVFKSTWAKNDLSDHAVWGQTLIGRSYSDCSTENARHSIFHDMFHDRQKFEFHI